MTHFRPFAPAFLTDTTVINPAHGCPTASRLVRYGGDVSRRSLRARRQLPQLVLSTIFSPAPGPAVLEELCMSNAQHMSAFALTVAATWWHQRRIALSEHSAPVVAS
jgi:hypothetical protein